MSEDARSDRTERPPPFCDLLRAHRLSMVVTVHRARLTARWMQTVALSQNELASRAGLDASLIHQLESGKRDAPRRATVERLADVLELGPFARAELLVAAGYWPWPDVSPEQLGVILGCGLAIVEDDYRPLLSTAPVPIGGGARLDARG